MKFIAHLRKLATLFALSGATLASAQYTHAWTSFLNGPQNQDDHSNRAVMDEEGNLYSCGWVGTAHLNPDVVLAKYDRFGALVWSKTWNGDGNGQDLGQYVAYKDGYLYVAGRTARPTTWYADSDLLTQKYRASDGQLVWSRTYSGVFQPGIESSVDQALTIAVGNNGDVFTVGQTWEWSYFFANADYRVLKYDAQGTLQWDKSYHGGATYIAISDQAYLAAVDSQGNLIVSGDSPGPNNASDIATIKYRGTDGEVLWLNRASTIDIALRGVPRSIVLAENDDVFIAANTFNNATGIIRHASSTGDAVWYWNEWVGHFQNRAAFAMMPNGDVAISVIYDPDFDDSNLNNNARTIRFRGSDGLKLWTHNYGTSVFGDFQQPQAVVPTPDDKLIVFGQGPLVPYTQRAMLLQYSPTGTLEWSYIHAAEQMVVYAVDMIRDPFGALLVNGRTSPPGGANYDIVTMKFAPQMEIVPPISLSAELGDVFYGDLQDICHSDDARMGFLNDPDTSSTVVRVQGKAQLAAVNSLGLDIELRASRANLVATIQKKNWLTGQFETVDIVTTPTTDTLRTISVTGNPARFIQSGTRLLEARISWMPSEEISDIDGWEQALDCVNWRIGH